MKKVIRTTVDKAGGIINPSGNDFVKINGELVAVVGDPVVSHGTGDHASATMKEGSSLVFINGISVCRVDDEATCGHKAVAIQPEMNNVYAD